MIGPSEAIETLGPADRQEALDHLDLVFSTKRSPHDFARMLPHCYQPENMRDHYVIRRDGRIAAMLGLFRRPWHVGGDQLEVVGIGGVSTHRRYRGQGLMRALMEHVVGVMQAQSTPLSWLAGHRLRYARYGYESSGVDLRGLLRTADVAGHALCDAVEGASFTPLLAGDDAALDVLHALHEARPARHPRPRAQLFDYLRAWHHEPWVARTPDGAVLGALSVHPAHRTIPEVLAADAVTAIDLACAWVRHTGVDHEIYLPPRAPAVAHALCRVAGGDVRPRPSGNWRVFDWPRVLRALLTERLAHGPVLPGSVTMAVGDLAWRVTCDGSGFEVEEAEASGADLSLDALTATRVWFGPLRPSASVAMHGVAREAVLALDQWCPLPLTWSQMDQV